MRPNICTGVSAEKLKDNFFGWQAAVFTANPDLADVFGLKSKKRVKLYNGPITCQLLSFNLSEQKEDENETGWRLALPSLREEAKDFSNRLRKNLKPFLKRAKKEGVSCSVSMMPTCRNITWRSIFTVTGYMFRSMRRRKH